MLRRLTALLQQGRRSARIPRQERTVPDAGPNPAVQAAELATTAMRACLDDGRSFVFEAGAGAGKTTSLVEAIRHLLRTRGREFSRNQQQIACITYTNVATDEIRARIDRNGLVAVSTIHALCWSLIEPFQAFMRAQVPSIGKWPERLAEIGEVGERVVRYSLGIPRFDSESLWLHHDDVLVLASQLLEQDKFRKLVHARFPVLLIDEYQDTNKQLAEALIAHVLPSTSSPLVGLFGDHWQKIYDSGCGLVQHARLTPIDKGANFRSVPAIVDCLNRMRPELPQAVKTPDAQGTVQVFHTNGWVGQRRTGQHWSDDLPPDAAHAYFDRTRHMLRTQGWQFDDGSTKVLMLTNRGLATEQGYGGLLDLFPFTDALLKAEDPHVDFLVHTVEPMCEAYTRRQYGRMFQFLGGRVPAITRSADKAAWASDLTKLMELRATGNIGAVLDHLLETKRPQLPESVERRERAIARGIEAEAPDADTLTRIQSMRAVPYREMFALAQYVRDQTPFSTKHGVKGAQFDRVFVVVGRGWNQYNFGKMLEWHGQVPPDKVEAYERNRNLFYVACSRPTTHLAILFTQRVSEEALDTLSQWFGQATIQLAPDA